MTTNNFNSKYGSIKLIKSDALLKITIPSAKKLFYSTLNIRCFIIINLQISRFNLWFYRGIIVQKFQWPLKTKMAAYNYFSMIFERKKIFSAWIPFEARWRDKFKLMVLPDFRIKLWAIWIIEKVFSSRFNAFVYCSEWIS